MKPRRRKDPEASRLGRQSDDMVRLARDIESGRIQDGSACPHPAALLTATDDGVVCECGERIDVRAKEAASSPE